MGLWDWITGRDLEDLEVRHESTTVADWMDGLIDGQGLTGSSAEAIPAVYRAIQATADVVASLPITTVRTDTGVRADRGLPVLERPDPDLTRHEFLTQTMLSALHRGEAFLLVTALDRYGHALAYRVLNPETVSLRRGEGREIIAEINGARLEYGRELLHIAWNRRPGDLHGRGPIQVARESLDTTARMESYARAFYRDAATPSGVLEVPGTLTGAEAADLKRQFLEQHYGKREPAVLSGGITWSPLAMSAEDSQWIQSREYAVADVARLFGMPGPLLGAELGGSLTYATTESVLRWWLTTTIQPTYLERIEQALSTMIPRTLEARFGTDQLLRADTQARFDSYATALSAGWLTVDEVRNLEFLEPLDGAPQPADQEEPSDAT